MKKIILFDLDGTLTDPMVGITKSVQYALKAYGIAEEDLTKLCPFIGPPLADSFKEFYGFSDKDAREAIDVFHEYFVGGGMFENEVYEGIEEMLGALRAAGYLLAVATSKPEIFAEQILEHFHLRPYFDLVGGADMDEIRVRKGEVIEYTLERLAALEAAELSRLFGTGTDETGIMAPQTPQTPPEALKRAYSIIMVGDRKHDVLGAKETGLPCIGILYGYGSRKELEEAGAEYIIENVAGLREFLLCGEW